MTMARDTARSMTRRRNLPRTMRRTTLLRRRISNLKTRAKRKTPKNPRTNPNHLAAPRYPTKA